MFKQVPSEVGITYDGLKYWGCAPKPNKTINMLFALNTPNTFQWYNGKVRNRTYSDQVYILFKEDGAVETFPYNSGERLLMDYIWHYT